MKVKAKRGERWKRKLREEVKSLELGLIRNRVSVKERVKYKVQGKDKGKGKGKGRVKVRVRVRGQGRERGGGRGSWRHPVFPPGLQRGEREIRGE